MTPLVHKEPVSGGRRHAQRGLRRAGHGDLRPDAQVQLDKKDLLTWPRSGSSRRVWSDLL
ncbi:hypothetical protein LV779_10560 [Streptomyces thinghirensis]|nr:hypothetical protein [Streptomyces thinghirensis]